MQVACDDDQVEPGGAEVDAGRLEVHDLDPHVELEPKGVCAKSIERVGITIDGRHGKACGGQQQRVTALPTGDVERTAGGRQQVDVVHQPRRWP